MSDDDRKYTSEGLPKVTLETINEFGAELLRTAHNVEEGYNQLRNWLSEIQNENPGVSTYIAEVAQRDPSEYRVIAFQNMIGLYMVLKRQSEKNTSLTGRKPITNN